MKKRNRIYTRIPLEERFWKLVQKTDTCWLWTGAKTEFGHGVINGGRGKTIRTHRISWGLHFGEIPEGLFVCHKCDVPACVNPDHLFLGTNADNMADCKAKGRYDRVKRPRGNKHGMTKVSDESIPLIRAEYATGLTTLHKLGAKYGVSYAQIGRIVNNQSRTTV
jgi:hypothetical protein